MLAKIFINYRRGDDPGFTQALYQFLEHEFPHVSLFMDVEGQIKPGDDFVEVLEAQVAACDVLLVVIGPRWQSLLDARRGEADDFVAIEIRAALSKGKRVVPVLVGGATMPRPEQLPDGLRPLARRNAVGLRTDRFRADSQGLVAALRDLLAKTGSSAAAELRINQPESNTSADDRRPAEWRDSDELANWDIVKAVTDSVRLRDHLARFPAGQTGPLARQRLEQIAWSNLGPDPTLDRLDAFLTEFPTGARANEALALRNQREALDARTERDASLQAEETAAWARASSTDTREAYTGFLRDWPAGAFAAAARAKIAAHAERQSLGAIFRRRKYQLLLEVSGVFLCLLAIALADGGKRFTAETRNILSLGLIFMLAGVFLFFREKD